MCVCNVAVYGVSLKCMTFNTDLIASNYRHGRLPMCFNVLLGFKTTARHSTKPKTETYISAMAMLKDKVKRVWKGDPAPKRSARTEETEEYDMGVSDVWIRDPQESWRRVILRAMYLAVQVHWEGLFEELLATTRNREDRMIAPTIENVKLVTRGEIMMRESLSRSKAKEIMLEVAECTHQLIYFKARGGKTKWWTCTGCGSRWPRFDLEELAVEDSETMEKVPWKWQAKAEASA